MSRTDVCFFLLFLTLFFFSFFFFFLIRFPEERFTCAQFCAYFAHSFSMCFVFFRVVIVHAQFMHARWFTAAFRLSFCDCHKKINCITSSSSSSSFVLRQNAPTLRLTAVVANFVQSNFGQSIFVLCCGWCGFGVVCCLCVVCVLFVCCSVLLCVVVCCCVRFRTRRCTMFWQ